MRLNRIAMWALLAGIVAGTAFAQTGSYGSPPGSQDRHDGYGQRQADPYDRQPKGSFDRYRGRGWDRDRDGDIDVGFFYDELSPYGEWVMHPYYGWVWFPSHVRAGWRPYSLGYWVATDYGWMWVSREPFGWATYHYGRWTWDRWMGWLWVPGTDWAPAWVAWQRGHGYIGWAPLPPAVGFRIGVGIQLGGFNLSVGIAPRDYSFVEERRFLDSRIEGHIVPQARNTTIFRSTANITKYTVVGSRVINHGAAIESIEQAIGRRAPRLRVGVISSPGEAGSVQRDVISVYRPSRNMLESVKVGVRNNAGVAPPQASSPTQVQPQLEPKPMLVQPQQESRPREVQLPRPGKTPTGSMTEGSVPFPIPVAPRIRPSPRDDSEKQFQREQQQLKANEAKVQRNLEQLHRQEMAQAQAKANAEEVAQRHAAELQAQKEERQQSERQLQNRQQIRREAAQASANAEKALKSQKAEKVGKSPKAPEGKHEPEGGKKDEGE